MARCARCDWEPDGDTLREHADLAGHPLCTVRSESLGWEERGACVRCIGAVRRDLAEIVVLYALLPAELGRLSSQQPDVGSASSVPGDSLTRGFVPSRARSSGERALPGGDALALYGPGSSGSQAQGKPHNVDHRPDDPPSLPSLLAEWEDDWRRLHRHPAASTGPNVTGAVSYLSRHAGWAAAEHPAFRDFARELGKVRRRLEDVTRMGVRPVRGVDCFDCSGCLVRDYRDPRPCRHDGPHTADCDQGGLADGWTCQRCKRGYSDPEYRLAVAAAFAEQTGEPPSTAQARGAAGRRAGRAG